MKNATQNQNNATKTACPTINSNINAIVTGINNCEIKESTKLSTNGVPPGRCQNEQSGAGAWFVPHAFALYDFTSKKTGDLNFKKGDIILLKRKIDVNWYVGEINGREGAIPMNYVQVIVPLPVPQCMALYDFKMGPNEEEGCLTFKKGTIINVLRRVDHNWAEGCIGSCIGIFPIAFVEMNALAKQLMESSCGPALTSARILPQIPLESATSDSSSMATTSPNSTCSSNTSTNSIPSSPTSKPNSPQNNPATKHDMKEKRHSLNALTANTNLSVVQSNRHSAEILTIPEPTEQSSQQTISTEVQCANNCSQSQDVSSTQSTARANVLKSNMHHNQPSLPWAYVALYPYKPRKSDELELKKGCVYFVTERCLDGWYKGKNWAEKCGVFPGNYVTPLRYRDQQQLIHQRKTTQNPLHSPQTTPPPLQQLSAHDHPNNQGTQTGFPPPELPPRSNTNTSASSEWAKAHFQAFLSKRFTTGPSQANNETKSTNTTPKHESSCPNSAVKHSQSSPQTNVSQQNPTKDKEKREQNPSTALNLMKRLTNIKRSKSPPNSNVNQCTYSMDNPVFEDTSTNQPLMQPKHSHSMSHHIHVRSGSCPSQLLQSLPLEVESASNSSSNSKALFGSQRIKGHKERAPLQSMRQISDTNNSRGHKDKDNHSLNPMNKGNPNVQHKSIIQSHQKCVSEVGAHVIHHRKSQSLDANTISSQITNSSLNGGKLHGSHSRESSSRFKCVVSYPPNSNVELELNVGDIVYVHRKLKDGWYKGTHARTNKTGLFPASFVEPDNL